MISLAVAAAVAVPGVTSAAEGPPPTTPAGTGGGCATNGRVIATAAQTLGPFGQLVRGSAPIADENARFFTMFCSSST
jgi:hypothetical protein